MTGVTDRRRPLVLVAAALLVVSVAGSAAGVAAPDPRADTDRRPGVRSGAGTHSTGPAAARATPNGSLSTADRIPKRPDRSARERLFPASGGRAGASAAGGGSGRRATVIATTAGGGAVSRPDLAGLNATVRARHGTRVQVRLPVRRVNALAALSWVSAVRRPRPSDPAAVGEGVTLIGADAAHRSGITGENVTVGIIDEGFDTSNPDIAPNVAAARSFRAGGGVGGADTIHGTAIAEIVVDVAPDADLYLAAQGTSVEFRESVAWLRERDVDVIVYSENWIGVPQDGTGYVSRGATRAAEDGIVFVNSASNYARTHWQARFDDADGDGYHDFRNGSSELNEVELDRGERLTVSLQWDEWPTTNDYDLGVFRVRPDGSIGDLVARSSATQPTETDRPVEFLTYTAPAAGTYGLAVRRRAAEGTATLELTTFDTELEYRDARGSIAAPAVAPGVTAVAAYSVAGGRIAPYSSRGPTDDGRRGVDIAGPAGVTTRADADFGGTSAAAPHVGGAAALVAAANDDGDGGGGGTDDETPREVRAALRDGATDLLWEGPDPTSGEGLIDVPGSLAAGARPPVAITDATLDPGTVGDGATVDVRIAVANVSDDGNADAVSVEFPDAVGSVALDAASVTDADGDPVAAAGAAASGTVVTLDVSPDSGAEARDLTVALAVEVTVPDADANTTAAVAVAVDDSTAGADATRVPLAVVAGDLPAVCPGGDPPTDPDGDGVHEDIDGDGTVAVFDAQCLLEQLGSDPVRENAPRFDLTGDGEANVFDAQALLEEL